MESDAQRMLDHTNNRCLTCGYLIFVATGTQYCNVCLSHDVESHVPASVAIAWTKSDHDLMKAHGIRLD